jgi:light-regulated signal transduction histidine kinase (bacteriophytochrome)
MVLQSMPQGSTIPPAPPLPPVDALVVVDEASSSSGVTLSAQPSTSAIPHAIMTATIAVDRKPRSSIKPASRPLLVHARARERQPAARFERGVLRNAVLYTADETAVEVKLVDDGESVELEVRDHGPGVPDEALADIFRPFHRLGDDRGRGTGGTGVGLAIAQRAVAWHGGTVTARNAPEGGLSVSIRLPLRGEARA